MNKFKLKNHPYSNCFVEHYGNAMTFISYSTPVIDVLYDTDLFKSTGRGVRCTGTYSVTTAKQITRFLREYLPDLSLADMKKIIGKGFVEM